MVPAIFLDWYFDLPTLGLLREEIVLEENDWMKLQIFKIAVFKCRKLKKKKSDLIVIVKLSKFSFIPQNKF